MSAALSLLARKSANQGEALPLSRGFARTLETYSMSHKCPLSSLIFSSSPTRNAGVCLSLAALPTVLTPKETLWRGGVQNGNVG